MSAPSSLRSSAFFWAALEKPHLLVRKRLSQGSATMGSGPVAAGGCFALMGEMTLSLPDGLFGKARQEAAAHRPRGAEIIRKTNLRSEAICRLGALGIGTYPPCTRGADPRCLPFQT